MANENIKERAKQALAILDEKLKAAVINQFLVQRTTTQKNLDKNNVQEMNTKAKKLVKVIDSGVKNGKDIDTQRKEYEEKIKKSHEATKKLEEKLAALDGKVTENESAEIEKIIAEYLGNGNSPLDQI